jgi:hypothetical protein
MKAHGFVMVNEEGEKPGCFGHGVGIHIFQQLWSAQGLEYSKAQNPLTGAEKESSL